MHVCMCVSSYVWLLLNLQSHWIIEILLLSFSSSSFFGGHPLIIVWDEFTAEHIIWRPTPCSSPAAVILRANVRLNTSLQLLEPRQAPYVKRYVYAIRPGDESRPMLTACSWRFIDIKARLQKHESRTLKHTHALWVRTHGHPPTRRLLSSFAKHGSPNYVTH